MCGTEYQRLGEEFQKWYNCWKDARTEGCDWSNVGIEEACLWVIPSEGGLHLASFSFVNSYHQRSAMHSIYSIWFNFKIAKVIRSNTFRSSTNHRWQQFPISHQKWWIDNNAIKSTNKQSLFTSNSGAKPGFPLSYLHVNLCWHCRCCCLSNKYRYLHSMIQVICETNQRFSNNKRW